MSRLREWAYLEIGSGAAVIDVAIAAGLAVLAWLSCILAGQ